MSVRARKIRWAALIAVLVLLVPAITWDLYTQAEGSADYRVAALPATPQLAEWAMRYTLDNGISLLALAMSGLALLVLWPRRRHAPALPTRQVGGLLARLTRPLPVPTGGDTTQTEYRLVVRHGGPTREHPLMQLNTFIGANPGLADIVLDDEYVSGRHASIQREGDTLYVVDLGSSNGTRLNSALLLPHTRALLGCSDLLNIGGLTLECVQRATLAPTMLLNSASTARNHRATIVLAEREGS